ncbi:MAG: PstS family phosphate ABC transporter substrate-binding protein [Pirellulales bacterium]|nr:PstS family phosphate ABC transporter substrate-binding protein [Pirellulales bacterium]
MSASPESRLDRQRHWFAGLGAAACLLVVALLLTGCGGSGNATTIRIDGSSTVFPITEAVAEEFRGEQPHTRVTVGFSGTGGGFKKLIASEIDICNASRPINQKEVDACKEHGIELFDLRVAFDGLAVVVNPGNDWVECLSVELLRELWRPESGVKLWSDLNPTWPKEEIKLYGPGTDSGTFTYFTEVIVGEAGSSRADYTPSENDNMLVSGIEADKHALGYFGMAYYEENREKLKLLGIDGGKGCMKPSTETVLNGAYAPLSRPLYLYIRKSALQRPEVVEFLQFYLAHAAELATEVGYVSAPDDVAQENQQVLDAAIKAVGAAKSP